MRNVPGPVSFSDRLAGGEVPPPFNPIEEEALQYSPTIQRKVHALREATRVVPVVVARRVCVEFCCSLHPSSSYTGEHATRFEPSPLMNYRGGQDMGAQQCCRPAGRAPAMGEFRRRGECAGARAQPCSTYVRRPVRTRHVTAVGVQTVARVCQAHAVYSYHGQR